MPISTKAHGVADYATAALVLAAPAVLRPRKRRTTALLRLAGASAIVVASQTDYELGIRRRIPMPVHLRIDAAWGLAVAAGPWLLGTARDGAREWLPAALVGAGEIAASVLTERTPGDRPAPAQAPEPSAAEAAPPAAATGVTGEGIAAAEPGIGLSPRLATPPIETPGPSVNAPALPESDTERAERIDAHLDHPGDGQLDLDDPEIAAALAEADPEVRAIVSDPDPEGVHPHLADETLAQAEAAAAAEARLIGGPADRDAEDPAMDPVYQAGGGEAEGFELAERDLVENATHGEGGANPLRDAFAVEAEPDRSGAVYGDPDELHSTELVEDPETGPEDPATGSRP
jgi:hypothetical protein